jgi:hypothetical protein
MPARRFSYQDQDCPLTLTEGMDEYVQGHPGLLREAEMSPEAAKLFHGHDICHVLFGLDTTIADEALADMWGMFGTDVGVGRYLKYLQVNEAQQIVKSIGWSVTIKESLRAMPRVLKAIAGSRSMRRKWPWENHEAYLNTPLADIRREFNIRVV